MKLLELLIVLVAALTPMFLLANEVSGDEFAKAGGGAATAGICLGVYQVWVNRRKPKNEET